MPNHAAFKRADVDDARRGHPAVDLDAFGAARGLAPAGQVLLGHFSGLSPLWPQYVFNVQRGTLPGGRFGVVQHELHEIALAPDGTAESGGGFHGKRVVSGGGWRGLIGLERKVRNEPFAAQAMWLPATGVKVLLPEAALLPRVIVISEEYGSRRQPAFAPGLRWSQAQHMPEELRDAVSAALGPILRPVAGAFLRAEVVGGAFGIRVDGFRADPAELDALIAAATAGAEAVARVCAPQHAAERVSFDTPLGPPNPASHPAQYRAFASDLYRDAQEELEADGAALGLVAEDPAALHHHFPHLPVPGSSLGVLAGVLPGTSTFGRLSWQHQSHPGHDHYAKAAALIAAPGAADTPPGGVVDAESDMYLTIVNGIAGCWSRTNVVRRLHTRALLERATATFGRAGLL